MIGKNGRMTSGVLNLAYDNEAPIRTFLENRGGTVLMVQKLGFLIVIPYAVFNFLFGANLVKGELGDFLRNLSIMLRSGVPIVTALQDAVSFGASPALKKIVEDISLTVEVGNPLSEALNRHPRIFSESVRFLTRIGEETGALDKTLADAAAHIHRIQQVTSDTKRAFIYPVFVFLSVIGAAMFWIHSVVPNMISLFRQLQVEIPPITLFMLDLSDFLEKYTGWFVLGVAVFIFLFVMLVTYQQTARYYWHKSLLYIPIVKRLALSSSMAFITEYFSLLVGAGVDILASLKILSEATPNEFHRRKILAIQQGLENGNQLSEEFIRTNIFPAMVIRMISIGEQSGTLSEQLSYIADEYRRQFASLIDNISELIKPLVIIFVGAIFAFIIGSLFLPIYTMIGQVGRV